MDKRDYLNIAARGISFLINMVITFFVTSFVIRNVGAEAYGFVGLANDFINYAQIIVIALNSMASRFVTLEIEKNDYIEVNKYCSSLFIMNAIVSVIISFFGTIIILNIDNLINVGHNILSDVQILWFFILLNFIVTLIGTVFQISTFCKKRFDLEALRTTESCILRAIVLLICYFFFKPFVWYVGMGTLCSSLYTLFFNIKYTKKLTPDIKIRTKYYSTEKIFVLLKAGIWNSVTQLGSVLSSGLDSLITNLFVNSQFMGVLSVSKTIPSYLFNIISTSTVVFAPDFIKYYSLGDTKRIIEKLISSIKLLSFVTIIPLATFVSIANLFYLIWVPNVDTNHLCTISLFIITGYIFVMPVNAVWSIYTALNKIKISSIYLIIESMVNVLTELIVIQFVTNNFYKVLVIVGISTLLMIIRAVIFLPVYTSKCIGVDCNFFYILYLKNLLIFSGIILVGRTITRLLNNSILSLFIGAIIIACFSTIVCYCLILNKDEKQYVFNCIKNKMKRGK